MQNPAPNTVILTPPNAHGMPDPRRSIVCPITSFDDSDLICNFFTFAPVDPLVQLDEGARYWVSLPTADATLPVINGRWTVGAPDACSTVSLNFPARAGEGGNRARQVSLTILEDNTVMCCFESAFPNKGAGTAPLPCLQGFGRPPSLPCRRRRE